MSTNKWFRLAAWGATALFLAASPAGAGPISTDPTGDTFVGGPVPDITTYSAISNPFALSTTFTVNFAGAISPPSTFAASSLVGFIDLDVDRNSGTGGTAPWGGPVTGGNNWINFFIPAIPIPAPNDTLIALGDEFYVDLSTEAFNPGFVDILDTTTGGVFATVPITFGPSSFSVTVPFVGADNGPINFGLLVGTFVEPTDRAPNGAQPAQTFIPEPNSLLAVTLLGLIGYGWRRRRTTRARRA
ncbi:MAG: PEP-CTERM sorting domain-containing protein [Gemmataceae bacterium]